jgi:outer membrane lipoprotein
MKNRWLGLWLVVAASLPGCAGISSQARSQVTYHGSFAELQARPEAFLGQVVLLGGRILETQPAAERSALNVLQLTLDAQDEPVEDDRSQGRFRVTAPRLLDPEVFRQGLRVTVVGRVSGSEVLAIGSLAYRMPVLEAIEIKLWPPQAAVDPYPRFHFGFGVGTWL